MNTHKHRNGLSVLEFVGCLMALVGGVWLGAIYLGIDLHRVAYVALSESKLMDQVPQDWRPETPESEKGPSQAELAASVHQELASLREDISTLRQSPGESTDSLPVAEAPVAADAAAAPPVDSAQQASLDYWNELLKIVHNQYTLQVDAELAATSGNATKVAALKGRVSRLTASSIRALNTKHVDPTLTTFGSELATWYESGADLYDQAVQVWGAAAGGQGNPQLTKEWQQAHLQFGNEGRLLRSRATTVRDALAQQFGVEFSPLAGL